MHTTVSHVFDLPADRAAKAHPDLVRDDELLLARLAIALDVQRADLSERRGAARRTMARAGQDAYERDLETRRLGARIDLLERYGLDLCLGRMVPSDGGTTVYVGRIGVRDRDGALLLVDWRAPAAAPFFAATPARPMGLATRRRYRWHDGRVVDYWDESLAADVEATAALDDQSAFLASLGAARSARMRDVVSTIQADQDAIVRASSRGALVVDGGPGTGKTVVALHRAAFLLHDDRRVERGGVLVIGPSRAYLDYVDDVLPGLGEDRVELATLADLVPGGGTLPEEQDPAVAALKADARLVDAIDAVVARSEQPPTHAVTAATSWGDVTIDAAAWAWAFDGVSSSTPHDDAHAEIWQALADLAAERLDVERIDQYDDASLVRAELERDDRLASALATAWRMLEAHDVVAALLGDERTLHEAAPWLGDEASALVRADSAACTRADLPLLDAARRRVGDRRASAQTEASLAERAAERESRAMVTEHLIASDDSELGVMGMLRERDVQASLDDEAGGPEPAPLAGPFAHVIVDEAQELTDAEWRMVLARVPSQSLTIVGDRAQARRGFVETWEQRLARVGIRHVERATLTVGYRTPAEVLAEAEAGIRAALPGVTVPTAVRESGIPVLHADVGERDTILDAWLAEHADGLACVIGDATAVERDRVRVLSSVEAKGLEFDLVVLVEPELLGDGVTGAVDRYVAMTRATERLVVLRGK